MPENIDIVPGVEKRECVRSNAVKNSHYRIFPQVGGRMHEHKKKHKAYNLEYD